MRPAFQSGIRYLITEADLPGPAAAPIRVFDLEGLGVDREQFLSSLAPSFARLGWDSYDVQREQVALLRRRFPAQTERLAAFLPAYWRGDAGLADVADLLGSLPVLERQAFDGLRCYRRRSIAAFTLTNRHHDTWDRQWRIVRTHVHGFAMDVPADDPRAVERVFDPTANEVVSHPTFRRLLLGVAEMTEDAEEAAGRGIDTISLTFHEMGIVARPGQAPTNAPEGVHQDGSDYIVSALVVERTNVTGGTSLVLDAQGRTLLEITLQSGQGIFQADGGSPLWHNVTPVRVQPPEGPARGPAEANEGVRNILGFDVEVARAADGT